MCNNKFTCKKPIIISVSLWMRHAQDDLSVSKLEIIPSFIRCYHAQQALEKMLKAAIAIVTGRFINLYEDKVIKNCGWELELDKKGMLKPYNGKHLKFKNHNLVELWEYLNSCKENHFPMLKETQKKFLQKASKYATETRYPYRLSKVDMCVGYVPPEDVEMVVQEVDNSYKELDNFICAYVNSVEH
ncbi:MAG: hypothetical protein ABSE54_11465 [Smithella sp.]